MTILKENGPIELLSGKNPEKRIAIKRINAESL